MPGSLVLVPNTLDLGAEAGDIRAVVPDGVLRRASALSHWVAEDARTTRAFLKRVGNVYPLALALQAIDIRELPQARKGTAGTPLDRKAYVDLLKPAQDGADIGLISEAGLPAVADPGALLVAAAHELGIAVQPLAGPNSLMLALAASGLNGQSFAFVGYVPQDPAARVARIRELEARSRRHAQTQILIETPYRNAALMQALVSTLSPGTRLSLSRGLTLAGETTSTLAVIQWRQTPPTDINGVPAVFSFLAG